MDIEAVACAHNLQYRFNTGLLDTSNYSATSNDMTLVHWPLMDGHGLLHLVQRGADWVEPQPAQAQNVFCANIPIAIAEMSLNVTDNDAL